MSKAELHVLRGRLEAGQRNKAQRGELFSHTPIGYVRSPEDGLVLEPDAQARAVVALIFAQFAALGSAAAVLRYLNRHQIRIGVRDHRGPDAGRLVWRRPNIATVLGMLRHPIYAGAYVWGRRCTDPRKRIPGRQGSGRLGFGSPPASGRSCCVIGCPRTSPGSSTRLTSANCGTTARTLAAARPATAVRCWVSW